MRQYRPSRGMPSFGPGALSPFIKIMLIANGSMFLLQQIVPEINLYLSLRPSLFFSEFPNLLYQPFTYMFLHGDFFHILFNMFALWIFGTEIEYTWGTKKFAWFYSLAGLSAAVLTLIVQSSDSIPVVGASGTIYGILIAYWLMFPNRMIYLYFVLPVKVKWFVPGIMIVGFLFGGEGVAHMAHLGGAIFGILYMKADWRVVTFKNKLKDMKIHRQEEKLNKNRLQAEMTMKKVDDILDKINDVGLENLSKEERKFLEEASSELSKKNLK